MKMLRIACATLAMMGAAPVLAQDAPFSAGVFDIVDEVRLGYHFHGIYFTMLPQQVQDWYWDRPEDISFDVLFNSPDMDAFRWIGAPRPEIGATINIKGEDSLLHAGLTWQLPIFETPLYLEGTFGAAATSGYLNDAPEGRRNFGCRVNFYERFGIGANLTENATATLTYEHTSNAGLCDSNAGLSNFGLRLGWKF